MGSSAPFRNQNLILEALTRTWSLSQECDGGPCVLKGKPSLVTRRLRAAWQWENPGVWTSCPRVTCALTHQEIKLVANF